MPPKTYPTGKANKPVKAGKSSASPKPGVPQVQSPLLSRLKGTYVLEPNEEFRIVVGSSSVIIRMGAPLIAGPGPGGSSSSPPGGKRPSSSK